MPDVYEFHAESKQFLLISSERESAASRRPPTASGRAAVGATFALATLMASMGIKAVVERVSLPPNQNVQSRAPAGESRVKAMYGAMTLGCFSGEAMDRAGLKEHSYQMILPHYAQYRSQIRKLYGADLQDMNYYGCGQPNWQGRIKSLQEWILRAGAYGDVHLALEPPPGRDAYRVFRDKEPEMLALKAVFEAANLKRITVWVRFASENNLQDSGYSVYQNQGRCYQFWRSAQWFRKVMPNNVRIVYSPLINTSVWGEFRQKSTIEWSVLGPYKDPAIWDRIGGTIYLTKWDLITTYDRYYEWLSLLAPGKPFQICEVGGSYGRREEVLRFLHLVRDGQWPKVEHVNLFAYKINQRADPEGAFGFVSEADGQSYLYSEVLADSSAASITR